MSAADILPSRYRLPSNRKPSFHRQSARHPRSTSAWGALALAGSRNSSQLNRQTKGNHESNSRPANSATRFVTSDAAQPAIERPTLGFATLTSGIAGSGFLFVDWLDTRRSQRYPVWQRKPGESAAPPAATVTESDATLTALTTGVLLEFQITAVSDAGGSGPGPVSGITLS